jgi:hypothetical protein
VVRKTRFAFEETENSRIRRFLFLARMQETLQASRDEEGFLENEDRPKQATGSGSHPTLQEAMLENHSRVGA